MSDLTLVVFSHLRWDFVYQRPQQIMSRFAKKYPVIFIEEPVFDSSWTGWEISAPLPNLLVYKPHTEFPARGFTSDQFPVLQKLLETLLAGLDRYVAWLYTPMAMPLVETLQPEAIIYDCMDELSLFLGAPPQLVELEDRLIRSADLIFTGGPSLFKLKKSRNANTYCFPSSVDADHFRQAANRGNDSWRVTESHEQALLPHPRLGFFGVIDERVDLRLLDEMADKRPLWQIIMVGPVVKIDPSILPKRSNLHYFGQRSYRDLPSFLVGWDVCLLPFALNDATRFISPTKTLEYMAAGQPIVSTPITDVAEPYGEVVYLAASAAGFCKACEQALNESRAQRHSRRQKMQDIVAHTSWEETFQQMERLLLGVTEEMKDSRGATTVPLAS